MQNLIAGKGVITFFFLFFIVTGTCFSQVNCSALILTDSHSGLALSGATVVAASRNFSSTTDSIGRVSIPTELLAAEEVLEITMVGYKSISVPLGNWSKAQRIQLVKEPVLLDEVLITNNMPLSKVKNIQMGYEAMTAAEAKKLPSIFGEVDIIKLLQLKPGIKSAGEGLAGLYVRGGGADQNLIMIDGIPLYNPNHLLGLFSVINNDAVRDVALYKAAYPAKYSGRLSSVLDIVTRPGAMDSFAVRGGVGVLSSRLSVESPIIKGRSSFIISGRRTYFDVFTRAINKASHGKKDYQNIPDYYFSDINLRSDWKINKYNSVWLTGYSGSDNFKSYTDNLSARFDWGNRAASLNWKSLMKKVEVTSAIFYSGYEYTLSNAYDFNNMQLHSSVNTAGMKIIAAPITKKSLRWKAGVDGMLHRFTIGDFKSSSDLSGFSAGEKASGNEFGAFVSSEWDQGKRLGVMAGLRVSGFYNGGQLNINPEPRLGGRINIGQHSSVKGSYTRMFQYLHLASLSTASLPIDMWYPSTVKSKPQYADQLSLGWSQAINNNRFFFSAEAYYKWMYNQIEFRDGANLYGNPKLENDFVFGKGNAYGLETYVEKKKGKTTGWIGYTLSWTTRTFEDINDGEPFRPRYDRRNDLSVVAMHKFNSKFTLSGSWIYGSGAYTTIPEGRFVFQDQVGRQLRSIIPVYEKRSNYQLAAVHRLDLSLMMALKSKRGSSDITFSLYNAYSRRNPMYLQFREISVKAGYVTAIEPTVVSLFPLLPGVTYNFRF